MRMLTALVGLGIVAGTFAATAAEDNGPTRLGGVSITVKDLDKATAFYKMIGLLEEQRRGEAPKRQQYMNIDAGNSKFEHPGLVMRESSDPLDLGNAYNVIIFLVKDPAAMCQKLADAKMPCDRPAHEEGPNKIVSAFTHDPDGHRVEFIQPKE